ncbi:hypothetical protein [Paenibacillus hamazuiensis]|uniref:hypothetical protein n=1 Tax=Paenibacillus hamazuiensis TaxID=2936508 RepID=UPI00200D3F21|nr:hypothetical protein [Paenibacillus hamazuiensis]
MKIVRLKRMWSRHRPRSVRGAHFALCLAAAALWLAASPQPVRAAQTAPPPPGAIKIDNRLTGTSDTVTVTRLSAGDTIRVYADEAGTVLLGSSTVPGGAASAAVSVAQLGADAGHVYVTVTSPASSESRRTVKSYDAEPVSVAPSAAAITVVNSPLGTADKVIVKRLRSGDTVRVYRDKLAAAPLGAASAGSTGAAEVSIAQLGSGAGVLFVTVTETGKRESAKVQKGYDGEEQTPPPPLSAIDVVNRIGGTADAVTVSGLAPGDVVKVYADEAAATPLGSATVGSGASGASVPLAQLGANAGRVYVTVTSAPKPESRRVAKLFATEPVSPPPAAPLIAVTNNPAGTDDTVTVSGLTPGDTVRVYADETTAFEQASAAVGSGETVAVARTSQLSGSGGYIYVSVTKPGQHESARVKKPLDAEEATPAPDAANIRIVNNGSGTADTVQVNGLTAGDIVRVYADMAAAGPLGSAAVGSGSTQASVSLSQLGGTEGVVYVTVTRSPKAESRRTAKSFANERQSAPPQPFQIRIVNHWGGSPDTVTVNGLSPGDVVKVYDSAVATAERVRGTVASGGASTAMSVTQLGAGGGQVYVTVTSPGKTESRRTVKTFAAEDISTAPDRSAIVVKNNAAGISDTVTVSGLAPGDTIRLYADESAVSALASATVPSGATTAEAAVGQLGTGYGAVYVTVTSPGRKESGRIPKIFAPEPVTQAISALAVEVANNAGGALDEITVYGLQPGDTVRIYADEAASQIMKTTLNQDASAVVPSGRTSVAIGSLQLDSSGGAVYITVQSADNLESTRVMKAYPAE